MLSTISTLPSHQCNFPKNFRGNKFPLGNLWLYLLLISFNYGSFPSYIILYLYNLSFRFVKLGSDSGHVAVPNSFQLFKSPKNPSNSAARFKPLSVFLSGLFAASKYFPSDKYSYITPKKHRFPRKTSFHSI